MAMTKAMFGLDNANDFLSTAEAAAPKGKGTRWIYSKTFPDNHTAFFELYTHGILTALTYNVRFVGISRITSRDLVDWITMIADPRGYNTKTGAWSTGLHQYPQVH